MLRIHSSRNKALSLITTTSLKAVQTSNNTRIQSLFASRQTSAFHSISTCTFAAKNESPPTTTAKTTAATSTAVTNSTSKGTQAGRQLNPMDTLITLCKKHGFIYQGSEAYGGLSGCFDYGPAGVELKKNISNEW